MLRRKARKLVLEAGKDEDPFYAIEDYLIKLLLNYLVSKVLLSLSL